MSLSAPFVKRPVATTLLTLGIAFAGLFAYFKLPVAPLPQIDYPTISVSATIPGASPETMAATVATTGTTQTIRLTPLACGFSRMPGP